MFTPMKRFCRHMLAAMLVIILPAGWMTDCHAQKKTRNSPKVGAESIWGAHAASRTMPFNI